jgi:hypothetical protein
MTTPEHSERLNLEYYVRIVAFAPDLQRASFHSVTEFLHHSTTIKLAPLSNLIKGSYLSLRASLQCSEVIISLVSTVARKFTQGRYSGRYLQSLE